MTDRDSPVTEEELHAFVDGELPADRKPAVEAWLSAHAEQAALVAAWRVQADSIRARYGAVAGEPVPARFNLDQVMKLGAAGGRTLARSWAAMAAAAVIAFSIGGAAGWMANGASAASPSGYETFTAEALGAYKLYVVEVRHPVEVPGSERAHMTAWLSKRLGYTQRIPDLQTIGLKLVGGRLLPGPAGQPAAFYMYEGASGERFTIYCSRAISPETAMRYKSGERYASFYWVENEVAYVVSGPANRERLEKITNAIYEQVDKAGANKS